jgi:hypothetical protein
MPEGQRPAWHDHCQGTFITITIGFLFTSAFHFHIHHPYRWWWCKYEFIIARSKTYALIAGQIILIWLFMHSKRSVRRKMAWSKSHSNPLRAAHKMNACKTCTSWTSKQNIFWFETIAFFLPK